QYKTGLLQIFEQLITNSLQHGSHTEGKVTITESHFETHSKFQLIDNGPGIPNVYREKVFNLFEKLSHEETQKRSGIGLTLVQSVLKRMNGSVSIKDRPDGKSGVCIEITLENMAPK
ncbi:MAG: sensor histidine kinase, partial [Bacteroidota bacterium]